MVSVNIKLTEYYQMSKNRFYLSIDKKVFLQNGNMILHLLIAVIKYQARLIVE